MLSQLEQKVCKSVLSLQDELISVLSELISVPTADPPGENYDVCVKVLSKHLETLGAHVEVVHAPPGTLSGTPSTGKLLRKPNVVAEIVGSENSPILHFNGHYDVVPAAGNWSSEPYKAEVREGRLYGRGSADMKGGIAAMIMAAKALKLENVNLMGTLSFSFVPDEENDGEAGAKFLTEQKRVQADYCIVGEPSGPTSFFNGHRGCLWLEITTHGKSAHASLPWLGVNAFDKMVKVIQEINTRIKSSLFHDEDIDLDLSTVSKTGTITLGGKVSSGDLLNVVPSLCTMTVDRRLAPGEDIKKVLGDFSSILDSLKEEDYKFIGDIKILSQYEACVTPIRSQFVNTLKELLKGVTGKIPGISLMMGGCDMRYFHCRGIPTLVYGPGDLSLAHQVDENVELRALVTAAQVYALTAIRVLGTNK